MKKSPEDRLMEIVEEALTKMTPKQAEAAVAKMLAAHPQKKSYPPTWVVSGGTYTRAQ